MNRFVNRAISAAAGTGKTYRLAHRFLGLMATEVPPDRICALTFSRKAAGEIFDKIVEHLCAAATDPARRAATAAAIRAEGLRAPPDQPAAYVRLLRQLLDQAHRLRIGTLDSFILGVVRAFPLELGIPPQTQPINGDGGEALAVRREILVKLFDPTLRPGREPDREGDAFLRAFRQACFGQENKALVAVLDRFIAVHYGFYRAHHGPAWHWGAPDRIWRPGESWWADAPPAGADWPPDLADRLRRAFGSGKRPEELARQCAAAFEAARSHAPDKPWPDLKSGLFAKLVGVLARDPPADLCYYKKAYPLPPDLRPLLRAALAHLVNVEVTRALERTRGLRAVLDRYDQLYAEALKSGGHFTFEDLSRLLGEEGLSPSRLPAAPNRLYIDYRLDGRLDHWLLDEFQDTSDAQWGALKNLIDEVVQDPNRSFFYVGDVKQSVYGWRGGNYRLFGEVLDQYAAAGDRAVVAESMADCHRSLPAVIEAVNRVFDGLSDWTPASGAERGPRPEAVAAFERVWRRHVSARRGEGEGYAALLEYAPSEEKGDDDAAEDPAEFEAVARVIGEVQPTRAGWSAAVLVRSNQAGRNCVDVLRRRLPEVPVVHEGTGGILDHPAVTLLLALVRYAAHPGDTLARRHLQMSPLARSGGWPDGDRLPGRVLRSLQERGFAGTLREWGAALGLAEGFGCQRLRELLAAAEAFDATGSRDPDAFADHLAAYTVKSGAASGAVRVMTIHQAKGLGFDLVVVPFSGRARSFERPGDPDLLAGSDWVFDPPGQEAFEAAGGAPLAVLEAARADANFAQLCLLYVALTRAQRALYLVVPPRNPESPTVREAELLRERLGGAGSTETAPGRLTPLYTAGDADWHRRRGGAARRAEAPTAAPAVWRGVEELPRREPSKDQAEDRRFPAAWLFGNEAGDVRAFGAAIHRLFEKIEWLETADVEGAIAAWRAESAEAPAFRADVERQFRACLASDEVRGRLARPAGGRAEVWREAPFDLVLDSDGRRYLMSGRFDRLVVERDDAGRPVRATIVDFKSNRVDSESGLREAAAGYAAQMAGYARAAARLLDLSVDRIEPLLLFTRMGRVMAAPGVSPAAKSGG